MLVLRQSQIDVLATTQMAGFAAASAERLADLYPKSLGRRPPSARRIILSNCFARAARHGSTRQPSLTVFAGLMLGVSPSFDSHPAVAAILRSGDAPVGDIDARIRDLPRLLPPRVWGEMAARRLTAPLYIPGDALDAAPVAQVAEALPVVFAGRGRVTDPAAIAARGAEIARRLGLGEDTEDILLCAACLCVYGRRFVDDPPAWLPTLWRSSFSRYVRLEALRARIALDTGLAV